MTEIHRSKIRQKVIVECHGQDVDSSAVSQYDKEKHHEAIATVESWRFLRAARER